MGRWSALALRGFPDWARLGRWWQYGRNWLRFGSDFRTFRRLANQSSRQLRLDWRDRYPCIKDRTNVTTFNEHYIYHTGWAARVLARTRPAAHVDISSSLYFVSIASAFVPVRFYDYRPADIRLDALTCERADLRALPFETGSLRSISCLHVIEHIGLGRYGDPLDPDGDLKAMAELERVLAPGGDLLLVVPVGRPRIEFNAHRIYAYEQIQERLGRLRLMEFALLPDDATRGLVYGAGAAEVAAQSYGCGCFWFQSKAD
jgi:SAM-dependent methyltransferase